MALCLVLISVSGYVAQAQVVNLGAHAGLNYPNARISGSDFSQYRSYGGAMVGIWARFGGLFYVQPEVNYTWSKSGISQTGPGGTVQSPVNLHYIQTVVSPGIRPVRRKGINLRLGGTASYSFLLAVNDNAVGITRHDFRSGAIHLGPFLGFDFWRITLDGRYLWSVRNQSHDTNAKWRNDMLQVALGFRFIGKR